MRKAPFFCTSDGRHRSVCSAPLPMSMTLTRHFVSFVPLCGPKCIFRDMRLHPSVFYSPVVLRRLEKADVISGGAVGGVRNGSTGQVTAGAGGFAYNTRTDTGVAVGNNNVYASKDGN